MKPHIKIEAVCENSIIIVTWHADGEALVQKTFLRRHREPLKKAIQRAIKEAL